MPPGVSSQGCYRRPAAGLPGGGPARSGSCPAGASYTVTAVSDVLLATDADWIFDEVAAALADGETTVHRVRAGRDVRRAVAAIDPDLVILDLQIGSMGGVAACLDLRLEAGAGRLPDQRVLLLLDRHADVYVAREAEADGYMVKPIDSFRIRRAARAVLAGEGWSEPMPTPV